MGIVMGLPEEGLSGFQGFELGKGPPRSFSIVLRPSQTADDNFSIQCRIVDDDDADVVGEEGVVTLNVVDDLTEGIVNNLLLFDMKAAFFDVVLGVRFLGRGISADDDPGDGKFEFGEPRTVDVLLFVSFN